jgi:Fanconi anemia group M protein
LVDGRLFPQVARLSRQAFRPILLIEGPYSRPAPKVHPHALKGAVLSIAVMWRVPVVFRNPEDSLVALRILADQSRPVADLPVLRRCDRKPKRVGSLKLHVLQSLPRVGPQLARRLLNRFGSVQEVIQADVPTLTSVRGVGLRTAQQIRRALDK